MNDINQKEQNREKDEITILAPNGFPLTIKYHPHDTVTKTLDHAVKEFAKLGQLEANIQYQLVLGHTPLDGVLLLEKAGVMEGATLKIRSVVIPGDGNALGIL